MKKLSLLILLLVLRLSTNGQTAASYFFTAFSDPFISISSTGTATTALSSDDVTSSYTLGFTFNFCGTGYTQASICSNGWIKLGSTTSTVYTNDRTSMAASGVGFLMGYWDDLHGSGHTAYYGTFGTAPNRVFIFEWTNFHHYFGSGNCNLQIKLYETSNIIDFCYGNSTYSGVSATIGIANSLTDWQTLPDRGSSPTPSSTTFTSSLATFPAANQVYRWYNECVGRPSAGTVISYVSTGCSNYTTTLSLSSGSLGGGIEYQWQYSTDSATWSDVSGATDAIHVASVTATIYYRSILLCSHSGLRDTTPGHRLALYTPPAAITGTTVVCAGLTTTLSDITAGGTWVSGSTSIATIGSSTGIVTGVSGGTSVITYRIPATGCIATTTVTVSTAPSPITGSSSVCTGAVTTLVDGVPGGTWTSSNISVATIGSSSGIVSGLASGTSSITYSLGAGCTVTFLITVNPSPSAITGTAAVCYGLTTTLADATPGGSWTSGNTTIATVGTGSGIVTGVASGTAIISYSLSTGCAAVITVTVHPLPVPISGFTTVCVGAAITLSSSIGGTWVSSNTAVGTIGSTTGILTGVSAGTTTVTYRLPTTCLVTIGITVNPVPAAITGPDEVCVGSAITVSNATSGGTWSSTRPSYASVGASTGVITGIAAGTSIISYTLSTGCASTFGVTVNPLPSPILGITSVCVGATTTLTSSSTGGAWTSSNTSVATIGSSTGIATGEGAGTCTVTYTLPTGCLVTATLRVNATPAPISGTTLICVGGTTTLTDPTGGGTWRSSTTSVATVGVSTGVVIGIGGGTSVITYAIFTTGCYALTTVTVSTGPAAITGSLGICLGSTSSLSSTSTGGTWSSSTTSVATIGGSTGVATAVSTGTATITYSLGGSCRTTAVVTVNPAPAAITGTATVCPGTTTTLTNTTGGGTWSSSGTGSATIGSTTGIVTGLGSGTEIITYTAATGCSRTITVTVNPAPAAISGATTICIGATATLTDATTGGTWVSSAPSTASAGSATGIVTGVAAGTATITYRLTSTGCIATAVVTVSPAPAAITGSSSVCVGSSITLGGTGSGTWSSSSTSTATAGLSTGIVSGIAAGTATITFTSATSGCFATKVVTVTPTPSAIGGPTAVCIGATITLTNSIPGGTWTSSTTSNATIGASTGIVTGVALGTTTITYILPSGCSITGTVSVSPSPSAILGASSLCAGATITLSDGVSGGSWTSSNITVATIGSTTGVVTGLATGTSLITYSLGSGCTVTRAVTVTTGAAAISGSTTVCVGATITLTNATTGGTWSSSSTSTATIVSGTGVVTGVGTGTTIISYLLPSGCSATTTVTVSSSPSAISGPSALCAGSTGTLTNAVPGGLWTSSNTSVATIGSLTGIVSALTTGTTSITYSLGTGCTVSRTLTVTLAPGAISGPTAVCLGATITLSNSVSGGIWTSSSTSIATVGSTTGIVTGAGTGTAVISYAMGTGCVVTTTVTVSLAPSAISGPLALCAGTTGTLTDAVPGGTWTSSSTSVATIGLLTGAVSALTTGTTSITYSLGTGCTVSRTLSVTMAPGTISGPTAVCVGATITLSNSVTGGVWTSGTTSTATISSSTGILTGVGTGTTIITYAMGTGCVETTTVTVSAAPGAITGASTICDGATTTLTNAVPGGTWTSSSTTTATIGLLSGILTGNAAGTTTITYSLGTGCAVTRTITVSLAPGAITGPTALCVGATISLGNSVAGGTWTSSSTGTATIGASTGVVTGVATGTSVITYSLGGTCVATTTITVSPSPGAIAGTSILCAGATVTLTNPIPGGVWTSSNTTVAGIGSLSGVVIGASAGTSVITYSLGTGCTATRTITVSPSPAIISGPAAVCVGATITLANSVTGGTWTSSSTGIATIGSASGLLSGIAIGSTTITYMLPGGCFATTTVTVNTTPTAIIGTAVLCSGSIATLSNAVSGGTWISGTPGVATIGASTGFITGIAGGTSVITYAIGSGCIAVRTITVNPIMPITGTSGLCIGQTATLADAIAGGVWTSGSTGVATVSSSTGIIAGISAGTTVITYTLPTGCTATKTITVNSLPAAITGTTTLCVGATGTVTDATAGGTWRSSNLSVATIDVTTGVWRGISVGIATFTYSLGSGCTVTTSVEVTALPSAITGPANVCFGATATLSSATGGGTWSSSTSGVSIGSTTGIATGVVTGTATITYTLGTGCLVTRTINVNALPPAIDGITGMCVGGITILTNPITGGTWTSAATGTAIVTSTSGIVTGISAGTTTISYTVSSGCSATITVSVTPAPAAITGPGRVCAGEDILLTDITPGGIWESGDSLRASVSTTGTVTGITSGTVLISYRLGTGCAAVVAVVVNPLSPITGPATLCEGQMITLTDTTAGGDWTSSSTSVATVRRTSGTTADVTGTGGGLATITYTLPTGCRATHSISVTAAPPVITGPTNVCEGSTITLSNAATGGTWASSATAIAYIDATSGVVTGVLAGTTTISYTLTGCPRTTVITVSPLPASIAGPDNICVGSAVTMTNATPGGLWRSTYPSIAFASASTGVVTGVAPGTIASIIYTTGAGCEAIKAVTVNPLPLPITGIANVCIGTSTTLSAGTAGGTWTTASPSAMVDVSTGVVTGLVSGTATITYMLSTGCYVTYVVTVNSLPPTITGPANVCVGSTATLSNTATGGTWTSSNPAVGSIEATTGIITGISSGTTVIVYTIGTGCTTSTVITVNPVPAPITGSTNICIGMTTTLSTTTGGGSWSSGSTSVATVDAALGVVTGVSPGPATIIFTISGTGCTATTTVNVSPLPTDIFGSRNICMGSAVTLSNGVAGGLWTSSNTIAAPIGSSSGIVTGVAPGTSNITYTLGAGCSVTATVSVQPLPIAYPLTGGGNYCEGGTGVHVYLSGSTTGTSYLLYVGTTPAGTFAGTGSVLDFGLQTVAGTYRAVATSATTGCSNMMLGTVTIAIDPSAIPSVSISPSPNDTVCTGTSVTYTPVSVNGGTSPAYQWSVNGVSVSLGGTYTFIPADGDRISVILTSNAHCARPTTANDTMTMTVNTYQLPIANITADPSDTVCKGNAVTLTAIPLYGGTAPTYYWTKNGTYAAAGPVYRFIPDNGDIVYATMSSNYMCRLADTVRSNSKMITVDTPLIPYVTITGNPGYSTWVGYSDTLRAIVSNAGSAAPSYQWYINGVPVPGATSATFISTEFKNNDSVSVRITSSTRCPITAHNWVFMIVVPASVHSAAIGGGAISVSPNPGKGTFVIKGSINTGADDAVTIEVTNMLGQVVYQQKVMAAGGSMNQRITLPGNLANGMYLLNLSTETEKRVLHIVLEQ